MSSRFPEKPLSGADGYKRLARLFARALYFDEMPPKTDDDIEAAPKKSKFAKHSFKGLGIILIDYFATKVDGYIDETSLASALRLSHKNIRKTLLYLEGERLFTSEAIKLSFRRKNAETPDDPEVEERKRQETHVYWCFDFPRFINWVRLKIAKIRDLLQRHISQEEEILQYICPSCGAIYSSLNAMSLLDPMTGTFRCEECSSELTEHVQQQASKGMEAATAATRKERQRYYKSLQARFEQQIKPIVEQLEKLKESKPPDHGSLQEWSYKRREEQQRRAKRLEAARQRAAAGRADVSELTEEQLLQWAEKADLVVALPGEGTVGGAGSAVPGKALPAWFRQAEDDQRQEQVLSGSVGIEDGGDGASVEIHSSSDGDAQRKMLEQQYLQQYLSQVRQAQAAMAAGGDIVGMDEEKKGKEFLFTDGGEGRDAKRMKVEEEVAVWEDAAGDGVDWEDA